MVPGWLCTVPMLHDVQTLAPAFEYVPGWQVVHEAEPTAPAMVPKGHVEHEVLPALGCTWPIRHLVHTLEPDNENDPEAQVLQVEAPVAAAIVPPGHVEQEL